MGGAASKSARQLPKTAKPTWAGARTPNPGEAQPPKAPFPRASETKDEAIERDSRDPQFMANLSKLGPVKVDHHMQTIRPAADNTQRVFRMRLQSEAQARSPQSTHNRLLASSLLDLLQERKSVTSHEEMRRLAERYDIDIAKLESVARIVNSPSIDEGSITKVVDEDGVERITMKAAWVDPKLQEPTPLQVTSGR